METMAAADMMLACDLILLARTLWRDGIDAAGHHVRLSSDRSELHGALSFLLYEGIRLGLPQTRQRTLVCGSHVQFALKAPVLWQHRQRVYREGWLSRLHYGCPSQNSAYCGLAAHRIETGGMLRFAFYCCWFDMRWYQSGLRLSAAWQHMKRLPELIAELERDLRHTAAGSAS